MMTTKVPARTGSARKTAKKAVKAAAPRQTAKKAVKAAAPRQTAKKAVKAAAPKQKRAVKAAAPKQMAKKAAKAAAPKQMAKRAAKAAAPKQMAKRAAKAAAPKKAAKRAVARVSPLRGTPVDVFVAEKVSGWQADAVRAISGLVRRVAPTAEHVVKWAQPVFELEGPFAFVRPAARHVTLGFWRGGELKDPKGVLEGDGSRMKHVKLRSATLDERVLAGFIREAVALNAKKGDPTRRG